MRRPRSGRGKRGVPRGAGSRAVSRGEAHLGPGRVASPASGAAGARGSKRHSRGGACPARLGDPSPTPHFFYLRGFPELWGPPEASAYLSALSRGPGVGFGGTQGRPPDARVRPGTRALALPGGDSGFTSVFRFQTGRDGTATMSKSRRIKRLTLSPSAVSGPRLSVLNALNLEGVEGRPKRNSKRYPADRSGWQLQSRRARTV